jgi:hypothetical protein
VSKSRHFNKIDQTCPFDKIRNITTNRYTMHRHPPKKKNATQHQWTQHPWSLPPRSLPRPNEPKQSIKMNHEISDTSGFRAFFFLQTKYPMIPAMASAPPTSPTTPLAIAAVCDFSAGADTVDTVAIAMVVDPAVLLAGAGSSVDAGPMLEPKVENAVGGDESLLVGVFGSSG